MMQKAGKREYNLELIADRIKYIRRHALLTQQEFADMLGISCRTVENLEKARNAPSAYVLFAIASRLHISIDYLLGVTERL